MVDWGLVPEAAIVDVRDLQMQMTALLITSIRNLEAEIARQVGNRPPGSARRSPGFDI